MRLWIYIPLPIRPVLFYFSMRQESGASSLSLSSSSFSWLQSHWQHSLAHVGNNTVSTPQQSKSKSSSPLPKEAYRKPGIEVEHLHLCQIRQTLSKVAKRKWPSGPHQHVLARTWYFNPSLVEPIVSCRQKRSGSVSGFEFHPAHGRISCFRHLGRWPLLPLKQTVQVQVRARRWNPESLREPAKAVAAKACKGSHIFIYVQYSWRVWPCLASGCFKRWAEQLGCPHLGAKSGSTLDSSQPPAAMNSNPHPYAASERGTRPSRPAASLDPHGESPQQPAMGFHHQASSGFTGTSAPWQSASSIGHLPTSLEDFASLQFMLLFHLVSSLFMGS